MSLANQLPPVVLLHGCGGSPEQAFGETGWAAGFASAGRKALIPRLPGHGREHPSHDPADYADLASALLPHLPEHPFDLVGFSLGAKLALDIAVRFPGSIRRMVLGGIGDNAFAPETIGDPAASALEHGPDEDTPPPVRAFLDTWDPQLNDPLAIAAVLRRPANPVFTEAHISAIGIPAAVVNGGADFVASMGTILIDALGIEQTLLPGIGHFDLTAQPAFRSIAIDFLGHKD